MTRNKSTAKTQVEDHSENLLARLQFRALTTKTWKDFEQLLGPRGGWGGCWCMWWRLPQSTFKEKRGEGNKRAFRGIIASGEPTGILAYSGGIPVGWCAVAPREVYTRLTNSRVLKPVDTKPVWSVSCFYVKRGYRRGRLSVELLKAAVDYATQNGAKIVEGYPQDVRKNLPDAFAWTGLFSAFRNAGFSEVVRRSTARPIVRKDVMS